MNSSFPAELPAFWPSGHLSSSLPLLNCSGEEEQTPELSNTDQNFYSVQIGQWQTELPCMHTSLVVTHI